MKAERLPFKGNSIREYVKEYNERVWNVIFSYIIGKKQFLNDNDLINLLLYLPNVRKGKGAIRPFSAYLGFLLSGGNPFSEEIVKVSAGIEIMNTSITYIDDKIFDEDLFVGESISLHKKYGIRSAMIVSSLYRSLGRELILEVFKNTRPNFLLDVFNVLEKINQECDFGQFLDIKYENLYLKLDLSGIVSLAERINDLRTGQFIRRSAELGALLAGADKKTLDVIKEAFHYFGRGVQDANDLEDVLLKAGIPGSRGRDAVLCKKTKPIVLLLLNYEKETEVREVLGNRYTSEEKLIKLKELFKKKYLIWCIEDLKKIADNSIKAIKKLKKNPWKDLSIEFFSILKKEEIWKD